MDSSGCPAGFLDIESIPAPRDLPTDPAAMEILEVIIYNMIDASIDTDDQMKKFLRVQQKQYHASLSHPKLLYAYRVLLMSNKIERNKTLEQLLKSKVVRGSSGVMVVTVVTSPWPKTAEENYGPEVEGNIHDSDLFKKPEKTTQLAQQHKRFSCKFDCFYCPSEPGQPKSYIKREPAVARANQHRFDAVAQFRDRGMSYLINGHHFDKVELIVLGGTWSSYPADYQEEFIRDIYYAANTFSDKDFQTNPRARLTLEKEIKINEDAFCRIIGLTLETRPDQITPEELIRFRRFGVTRIQLGIQHSDDDILDYVNRGCKNKDAILAIKLCKDAGFKVDIHIMPDLPSSTPEKDRIMFEYILNSPDLQADQWKIYPCSVVPWTRIEKWYQNYKNNYNTDLNPDNLSSVDNRKYKPYAEDLYEFTVGSIRGNGGVPSSPLIELLIDIKAKIHPWIRINRLVRDIPGAYISGGNDREDLRQVLQQEMKSRGMKCKCIRCREVKNKKTNVDDAELVVREYEASDGREYFLSYETPDREIIYGFLRLRIPSKKTPVFPELANTALIRELHVYGNVVPVNTNGNRESEPGRDVQHSGFGKKLLRKAEELALQFGFTRVSVIAGVGVRNYYRKQGYVDVPGQGYFQVKTLSHSVPPPTEDTALLIFIFYLVICYLGMLIPRCVI